MSVILSMFEESKGNGAAQTGNIIHDACEAFHKAKEDRVNAGLQALEKARLEFPDGDPKKSEKVFRAYAADPKNADADVPWCEAQVTLRLAPAPEDKTGKPVVIVGTLDQVRRHSDGSLRVWDIKTGDRLDADETVNEYLIQQAIYTLGARQTLDPTIGDTPGGIIYTPGYERNRGGKTHIPLPLSLEAACILVSPLVHWIAQVRAGLMQFRPSAESCRFCPIKPWPTCITTARCAFGHDTLTGV